MFAQLSGCFDWCISVQWTGGLLRSLHQMEQTTLGSEEQTKDSEKYHKYKPPLLNGCSHMTSGKKSFILVFSSRVSA